MGAERDPVRIGGGRLRAPLPLLLLFAGTVLLAFLFYREALGYALVGHDTYPIILTSRVEGPRDLVSIFTSELMDGRYPEGSFYRPVLNVSFALDHALYGLRPWGYHLTDLLLLALTASFIGLVAAPALSAPRLASFAGALFFLAHPVQMNILPVAARRADMLALLFTTLALLASRRLGRLGRWGPALFALLAAGSKETGAIAPLLLFASASASPAEGSRGRLLQGLRCAAAPAAAVVLYFLARQVVIGGLGGHGSLSVETLSRQAPLILLYLLRYAAAPFFGPRPIFGSASAGPILFATVLLGSILYLRRGPSRGIAVLAWTWIAAAGAVHALALTYSTWYALHAIAPIAVLSGMLLEAGLRAVAGRARAVDRAAGVFFALAVLLPAAVNIRNSPLLSFHPEWRDATRISERYLDDLEKRIRRSPAGSIAYAPRLPYRLRYRYGSPIGNVSILSDYTVQAWAELVFPGRAIRVVRSDPPPGPPSPGETLVVVSPEGSAGGPPLDGAAPRR